MVIVPVMQNSWLPAQVASYAKLVGDEEENSWAGRQTELTLCHNDIYTTG